MSIRCRHRGDSDRIGSRIAGRWINAWILCLVFLIGLQACSEKDKKVVSEKPASPEIGVDVGQRAPDFKLKNLRGGITTLSEYRGKVVLVNFWATWCEPCRAEMPSMEELYSYYSRNDFEILALSIDTMGEPPVRFFVEDFGFTFPVLMDNDFAVNDRYQVRVVPTTILIDRDGTVSQRLLGAKDWTEPNARLLIEKLVKGSA